MACGVGFGWQMMGMGCKFDPQITLFNLLGAVKIGGMGQKKMNYTGKIYTTINHRTIYRG